MRSFVIMMVAIIFMVVMVRDGLKTRARPVTLLPDLIYSLSEQDWEVIETGLDYKTARLKNREQGARDLVLHIWRFDPKKFHLEVVNQHKNTGSWVKTYREKAFAVLAINGGFFGFDKQNQLKASGLVVAQGKKLSPYHRGAGSGLFYEQNGKMDIGWAKQASHYSPMTQALQVGPMVVDPNGKNGIGRNDGKYAKRSVICKDFQGRFMVVVIDGKISLFETGKLLSTPTNRGGLGCERALNLDGGPSTMVDYDYKGKKVHVSGRWPVVNALVLTHRKPNP